MGWRIGVYWKDDQKFYNGEVESFETATGRHVILYDDGELVWILPSSSCTLLSSQLLHSTASLQVWQQDSSLLIHIYHCRMVAVAVLVDPWCWHSSMSYIRSISVPTYSPDLPLRPNQLEV